MCLCTCKSACVCVKACELVYIGACELGNRVGHYAWLFFSDKTRSFVQMEKLAKNPTDYLAMHFVLVDKLSLKNGQRSDLEVIL